MAATATVSTVGAGPVVDGGHIGQPPSHARRTFKRTMQHYITNAGNSTAPAVVAIAPPAGVTGPSSFYKEGWFWIPYTDTRTSMTQANRDEILLSAKRFRCVGAGFKVKRLQCMYQQVTNNASTTSITNNFVQAPALMHFRDTEHEIYENAFANTATYPTNNGTRPLPIWNINTLFTNSPNTTAPYANPFSTMTLTADGVSGTMREVMIGLDAFNFANVTVPSMLSLMHGGDIEWVPSGGEISGGWENPVSTWQTPQPDTAANGLYTTTTSFPANVIQLYENMATSITQLVAPPMMHLLRVPPLSDVVGAMIMHWELIVEYSSTWEWEGGRYVFGRSAAATGATMGTTVLPALNQWPTNARTTNFSDRNVNNQPNPNVGEKRQRVY